MLAEPVPLSPEQRSDPRLLLQRVSQVKLGVEGIGSSPDLREKGGFVSSTWAAEVYALIDDMARYVESTSGCGGGAREG